MAGGRGWVRRAAAAVAAAVVILAGAGCGATATVAVRVGAHGAGTLAVRVTLDRAASREVGGLGQLRTADLVAAGWAVTGPSPAAGGGSTVEASHPFSDPAELGSLLHAVASTRLDGRDDTVFRLGLRTTGSSRRQTTVVTGSVDLSCGVDCFGDSGLRRHYGSDVGVDPRRVAGAGAAARDLHVLLTLSLPGRIRSDDATSRRGGVLTWDVPLGRSAPVSATATVAVAARSVLGLPTDGALGAGAAVVGVVVAVVVVVAIVAVRLRRGRPRRRA